MLTADPRPYEGHSTRNQHRQEEYHADPMESCGTRTDQAGPEVRGEPEERAGDRPTPCWLEKHFGLVTGSYGWLREGASAGVLT